MHRLSFQEAVSGAGAAGALCNLAESNPENQAAITCTAALDAFPRLLREGLASHSFIVEVGSLSHCAPAWL